MVISGRLIVHAPAGRVLNLHARLMIFMCNMAEEAAALMEQRPTDSTVPPDSMLAVFLQMYAYQIELPRLRKRAKRQMFGGGMSGGSR